MPGFRALRAEPGMSPRREVVEIVGLPPGEVLTVGRQSIGNRCFPNVPPKKTNN